MITAMTVLLGKRAISQVGHGKRERNDGVATKGWGCATVLERAGIDSGSSTSSVAASFYLNSNDFGDIGGNLDVYCACLKAVLMGEDGGEEMKLLRMKKEYIDWTAQQKKRATTRTKNKGGGEFELVSGSRYKPVKSGVQIYVYEVLTWTIRSITPKWKAGILAFENFDDWETFISVLEKLNKRKIGLDEELYTHFYVLRPIREAVKKSIGKEVGL